MGALTFADEFDLRLQIVKRAALRAIDRGLVPDRKVAAVEVYQTTINGKSYVFEITVEAGLVGSDEAGSAQT